MGYYASGSGYIYLRPGNHAIEFERLLKDDWFEFETTERTENGERLVCIDLWRDGNYHSDVDTLLEKIEPYVVEGCLEYHGEDGHIWRFIFQDGHFVEEDAEFYYPDEIGEVRRDAVGALITPQKLRAAEQVLVDNGIEPDEADIVLQAVGYALLDAELYKE